MATDPLRQPSPAKQPASSVAGEAWNIKRAENLISSLRGVLSTRIVAGARGDIEEIHVFTQAEVAAKQVVRNVESALLAHLGIRVDHRKISVAQTAEVTPLEILEDAARPKTALRGFVFEKLAVTPLDRSKVKFTIGLSTDGQEVVAEQECADTPKARIQAAARVAVTAVDSWLQRGALDLEGATVVDAFNTSSAFVGVYIVEGRNTRLVTGSCEIRDGVEQAAALAVLDAVNRWVQTAV